MFFMEVCEMTFAFGSCKVCGGQFTCCILLKERMPALCPACWWERGCRIEDDGRASWDDELILEFERYLRWELLPMMTIHGVDVHLAQDKPPQEEVELEEP
jgi:hypothetical protein